MAEENKELTPEQLQNIKLANTAGFIQHLVTDGIPDPEKKGSRKPVTVEEATALYKKAESFWNKVAEQKPKVKETIMGFLKEPAAAKA